MKAAPIDCGEGFYRAVLADVNGTADDETADMLRADAESVSEWIAVLTRMIQDGDAALSRIRADIERRQQECIHAGPRRKSEFFAYKAERERERAGLVRQKAAIVERLKEAKDARSVFYTDASAETKADRLVAIEAKLDRIIALLARWDSR